MPIVCAFCAFALWDWLPQFSFRPGERMFCFQMFQMARWLQIDHVWLWRDWRWAPQAESPSKPLIASVMLLSNNDLCCFVFVLWFSTERVRSAAICVRAGVFIIYYIFIAGVFIVLQYRTYIALFALWV